MITIDFFPICQRINFLLEQRKEGEARDEVIKLLDEYTKIKEPYPQLLNHLIRLVGLYPYIQSDNASWSDKFVYEVFKSDIGLAKPVTLHREQSKLLKKLVNGESVAVSAPTSFGKSFVIDAYISIIKPKNIAIIVPTLSLTDETRRRLYPKFSNDYKIITTTDVELSDRNIFIFPQERAIDYSNKIQSLDIMIIDEFYKASKKYDKERSPSLQRAMLKLGGKAKQKYFLAPNIQSLKNGLYTDDVEFLVLDFKTVILEKHDCWENIKSGFSDKSTELLNVLNNAQGKTLVYAGSYPEIDKVLNILDDKDYVNKPTTRLLEDFSEWLSINYSPEWALARLIKKGVGVHNGQLHRSLSQIQVKLFEEKTGISALVSTSSIIEGVNTSAENVILWKNKNGNSNLTDFTYRNLIGRGGRMFKHFIGKIYLLEKPPKEDDAFLDIEVPDELLSEIDEDLHEKHLTKEQISKIVDQREELLEVLGKEVFNKLRQGGMLQLSNWNLVKNIAIELKNNPEKWKKLNSLHLSHPHAWRSSIYNVILLKKDGWDVKYGKVLNFVEVLSENWELSIPEMLEKLKRFEIDINLFFKLERKVSFKLSSLLHDVNSIQKELLSFNKVDISPFIVKVSHAFLPIVVYQLEEYGLPRSISKKIHHAGVINFQQEGLVIHDAIAYLNEIGLNVLLKYVPELDRFDKYVLNYFFEGISIRRK